MHEVNMLEFYDVDNISPQEPRKRESKKKLTVKRRQLTCQARNQGI